MAEIQRYRPARGIDCDENLHSYMIRDKFGSCVKYNDHIAAIAALTAERDALKRQVARLSAPVSDAAQKAAIEICQTYDVTAPRGVIFANSKQVTVAIIIEQAFIAAPLQKLIHTLMIGPTTGS